MSTPNLHTLGALKASGYQSKSVRTEMRENLIRMLKSGTDAFPGLHGYEESVIPELERAILSEHTLLLLGLRGQAKTRIARQLIGLLDPYMPIIKGSILRDDPLNPISRYGKEKIALYGDETEIEWISRADRYTEKLATPDVSVADLIGDTDPILAANLKLSYSDERVIHYGLIPRANRGIFVMNEIPDLQARIQVSLFNVLQEGDIQIRGFMLRLPLDIAFMFTANPEDYTQRGSLVTPLKDRIQSQILTHYPKSREVGKQISQQEAQVSQDKKSRFKMLPLIEDLIEQVAIEARQSEYVDVKSGVSARMTISLRETLYSVAERRTLLNGEPKDIIRVSDLFSGVPAISGKMELVYEGEQEGAALVARNLIKKAIKTLFEEHFPNPEVARKRSDRSSSPYSEIVQWFSDQDLDLMHLDTAERFKLKLSKVKGLENLVKTFKTGLDKDEQALFMEFVLHGLSEFSMISKQILESETRFRDLVNSIFQNPTS